MSTRSFSLVLAGGGARGYAHVGVLRALESMELAPSAIVGVSMGSLVAATYGLRDDWFEALCSLDVRGAPSPGLSGGPPDRGTPAVQRAWAGARVAWSLLTGWGAPDEAVATGRRRVEEMIGPGRLEDCRIPVTVCATDLLSGLRTELDSGPAATAIFASSALAGIVPPVEIGDTLLADGVYSDIAPVDVARAMGPPVVIVVDPTQGKAFERPRNGLQVVMRAMEICHMSHAHERIGTADLVIRPLFQAPVDVLEFEKREMCVEAGWWAARGAEAQIRELLDGGRS